MERQNIIERTGYITNFKGNGKLSRLKGFEFRHGAMDSCK